MILWGAAMALAGEPWFIDDGVRHMGYDGAGVLWVETTEQVVLTSDGRELDGQLLLAADGQHAAVTSLGRLLSVHVDPTMSIDLGFTPRTAEWTDAGDLVAWNTLEQAHVDVSEATFVRAKEPPAPQMPPAATTGRATPGTEEPLVQTDRHVLAVAHPRPGEGGGSLVWRDRSTGDVRRWSRTSVRQVALAPDQRTVSIVRGLAIDGFDLFEGRWTTTSEVRHRHHARVLAQSDDGRRVLTADRSGRVILWSRDDAPRVLPTADVPEARQASSAAFSGDGLMVAITYDRGTFSLHDTVTGELQWHGDVDPAQLDGPVTTFEVAGLPRHVFSCGNAPRVVLAPVVTGDRRYLVTQGLFERAPSLLVWDVATGAVVRSYRFDETVAMLGLRPDGRLVAQAGDAVFALHVGPEPTEPELLAHFVRRTWLDDEGRVRWIPRDAPPSTQAEPPSEPNGTGVELRAGQVVFPGGPTSIDRQQP